VCILVRGVCRSPGVPPRADLASANHSPELAFPRVGRLPVSRPSGVGPSAQAREVALAGSPVPRRTRDGNDAPRPRAVPPLEAQGSNLPARGLPARRRPRRSGRVRHAGESSRFSSPGGVYRISCSQLWRTSGAPAGRTFAMRQPGQPGLSIGRRSRRPRKSSPGPRLRKAHKTHRAHRRPMMSGDRADVGLGISFFRSESLTNWLSCWLQMEISCLFGSAWSVGLRAERAGFKRPFRVVWATGSSAFCGWISRAAQPVPCDQIGLEGVLSRGGVRGR